MSDCVNLVAPASHIECFLHLPNVRTIQYNQGPERLIRLGNSNVLRLPVKQPLVSNTVYRGRHSILFTNCHVSWECQVSIATRDPQIYVCEEVEYMEA